jgi:hypothetical protein
VATLNIPEEDQPGLALICDLPDDVFASLLSAVQRSPSSVPTVPNIAPGEAEQIMDSLKSMYRVREYVEVQLVDFVSDICEALLECEILKEGDELKMVTRLTNLLKIESLATEAKATLLRFEHERRLCTARILTDARPVFGADVTALPVAVIIGHMLKISYHEGGEDLKDIYVALRSRDLVELREQIDRAEKKEKSLRAALEAAKLKIM